MMKKLFTEQKMNVDLGYDYTYEQWLLELSNFEYHVFAEYMELYQTNPQAFLQLLTNKKKQEVIFEQMWKFGKKKLVLKPEKKEAVEQFFQEVPMTRLLAELSLIPYTFDYRVEKNVAKYILGQKDGDKFVPFSEDALKSGALELEVDGEKMSFSVQSLIYFLFANEILHQKDEQRIIRCKTTYLEATYAFSYAHALQEESLDEFMISVAGNSVTSAFFTSVAFSKAMRFLNDALSVTQYADDEEYCNEIVEQFSILSARKQFVLGKCHSFYLQRTVKKLEMREKQGLKKQQDFQQKIEKQKSKLDLQVDKIEKLKQELVGIEKSAVDQTKLEQEHAKEIRELEQSLTGQITDVKQQLKTAKDDLRNEKKNHAKAMEKLEDKLEQETTERQKLNNDVSELQKKLVSEQRQKLPTEELKFDDWLQKGSEFLQHLSLEEEESLKDFIALAQNIMEQSSLARPKNDLATNRIGYCRVDSEGHFVNLGDDEWHQITAIPLPVYLSDNQFVEVTKDYELVSALGYYYMSSSLDHTIKQFVAIEERHGQAFAKVDGKMQEIKYRDNAYVNDGQVISVNQVGELVRYYQYRSITLDDWLTSIQLKGHEPLYVTMSLASGYVVRSLTEEERFLNLEEPLLAHSFIILDGQQQLMYKDTSGCMLKQSAHYTKKQLASVSELEEGIYVLKANQEYVKLHDVPQGLVLDLGDLVWVDEFNRYIDLGKVEQQYVPIETIEKKLLDCGRKVTRKAAKTQVEKNKDLLVIGNIRISERYKSYFGELGYEVDVVDGTGPFEKIRQACSKHTNILYSTAFTSHKNSGKMSKEVVKPYILCDSTAPKVMHYALENIS